MKVPHCEGVATHTGPESWAEAGNGERQALTGRRAGRVSSREILLPWRGAREVLGADVLETGGRQYSRRRLREAAGDPTRSETLSTYVRTAHGNREIPRTTALREAARIGQSKDERR